MITKAKYIICGFCVICGLMSCEDMLESDSSRQLFDPELNQKTDSVFYAYGIMQAMQEEYWEAKKNNRKYVPKKYRKGEEA